MTLCYIHCPANRPSMKAVVERIREIAVAKSIDLAQVTMPAWKESSEAVALPGSSGGVEGKGRFVELEQERARLAARLDQARKQREKIEQLHLAGTIGAAAAADAAFENECED